MVNVTLSANERDVHTKLSYITPTSKFNRRYVAPGAEVNTGVYEEKDILIKDGRPERAKFTLDTSGFALIDHNSKIKNFHDTEELEAVYVKEIEEWLKELTGADKVIAFGPTLRQTEPQPGTHYQPPGRDVHIDYKDDRSHRMAQTFIAGSDEPDFQYSRFQCINVWRAISPPPQDWPLAICDAQSVAPDEGTQNLMIRVDKLPELDKLGPIEDEDSLPAAYLFTYKQGHRWYYFSDMKPNELLLFKLYDSANPHGRCPHAAFLDEGREGAIPRESVEIRTILYFK